MEVRKVKVSGTLGTQARVLRISMIYVLRLMNQMNGAAIDWQPRASEFQRARHRHAAAANTKILVRYITAISRMHSKFIPEPKINCIQILIYREAMSMN